MKTFFGSLIGALAVAWAVAWIFGIMSIPLPASAAPGADAPAVDNDLTPATGGDWDRAQKCEWLKANFPQSTAGVQAYGVALVKAHGIDIPAARVRTHIYHCTTTEAVFDGLIILGPNEGFSGAVKVTVPENGAVDGYDPACGAVYSTTPVLINRLPNRCDSTWRVVSGTAQGLSLTVWAFNDGNSLDDGNVIPAEAATPEVQATVAATTTVEDATMACIDPVDLAVQKGWMKAGDKPDWADQKYGGLRVEINTADTLPDGWEAQTSGLKISQNSEDRTMVPDFWSIYPPFSCRAELGYE